MEGDPSPDGIRCTRCGSTLVRATETVSFIPDGAECEVTFVVAEEPTAAGPSLIGDYDVIEEVARGGMGVVYKARQRSLNRIVALKMIRSGELANADQVARFHIEAEAAAQLDHPGIVPVYEVGEHDGQHFYSMAFVDGVSLHEKVKNDGPLPPRRAAQMVRTVAEAVQFGHDKGITNRDIKPQNILLDQSESPRVTDFGLARHGDSEMTVAGQIMGTPSYMPPEQAEGKIDEVGPASDVYSLGATLYYVLTGRPPFQAASMTETLRQVVHTEPASPRRLNPDIPCDLETICLKCLRKERAGRYSSSREFADDLGRWLENKPIVARRVSTFEKTWLWCRRRPAIAASIVAILIAAVIFAGVAAAERRRNLEQSVRSTVATMSTARGILVPHVIDDLEKFPHDMALAELREQFESADGDRKLGLAYALAHYDDVRVEFLVFQVKDASQDEIHNFVTALGHSSSDAVGALEAAARTATDEQDWRHKARLAVLALHLSSPTVASEMCELRPDPIQRAWFIDECSTGHGNLSRLAELVSDSDDVPLRSAVALAAGSVPEADVTSRDRQAWLPVLSNWYRDAQDTLTHSAADWTLRKWNLPVPELAASTQPTQSCNWCVNSVGMTMLVIPAGRFVRRDLDAGDRAIDQTVTLTRAFLMGDCEVTRAQYQTFIDDPDYPADEKPEEWHGSDSGDNLTEEHPIQSVNSIDAVLFCNWLSRKEGLPPCYERSGERQPGVPGNEPFPSAQELRMAEAAVEAWRLVPEANGYRLPTEAEWEYACRAETRTEFCFGDDETLLDRYAVYRSSTTDSCRSKLPNSRGLFDMHGNVFEWCGDSFRQYGSETAVTDPVGGAAGPGRVLRGGSFSGTGNIMRSSMYAVTNTSTMRRSGNGFRVVKSYP